MTTTDARLPAGALEYERRRPAVPAPRSGTRMDPEEMARHFTERLEERVVATDVSFGLLTVTVVPEALPMAARLAKTDPRLEFNFFEFTSGVDLRDEGFAVVVHLYSIRHGHHVELRAVAAGGREEPRVPSLAGVFRGANWSERETYDMFGIDFEGHPGLLPRILTVENFEGWPLRKDFLLSSREVKAWPGLKEPKAPEETVDAEAADGQAPATPADAGVERHVDPEAKANAAKEKAERAKRKAAEMRAKKARERAEQMEGQQAGEQEAAPTADGVAPEDSSARDFVDAVGTDTVTNEAARESGGERPGAPPQRSGAPGEEAEGRHAGADEQTGEKPAAETPGMTSPTQDAEAARPRSTTPAPGPETDVASPDEAGSDELPESDEPGSGAKAWQADADVEDAGRRAVERDEEGRNG